MIQERLSAAASGYKWTERTLYNLSHAYTHAETALCVSLSFSVMHYRPLFYFADRGLSSGLDPLSTHTHTHTRCDHSDLLACRTRLDFQYGLVLQHSAPSVPPPVGVDAIRLVCRFLCLVVSFFLYRFIPVPAVAEVTPRWGSFFLRSSAAVC